MHVAKEAPQHKRVPRTGREIVGYDSEAAFSRAFKKTADAVTRSHVPNHTAPLIAQAS